MGDSPATAPLTDAQRRLFFLDQLEPGGPEYVVPLCWRLTGPLDPEALRDALAAVLDRHDALRTTFALVDGEPRQQVLQGDFRLTRVDVPGPDAMAVVREHATRPFDLGAGPLLRATLVTVAPEEALLLVTMHHIVSDGLSADVLLRDLSELYRARIDGRAVDLPELPIHFADVARREREWLDGEEAQGQLEFWRRTLDGLPALGLPTDRPRAGQQSSRGGEQRFVLSPALSKAVRHASRRLRVTPYVTYLTALHILLGVYGRQDDVAVGTVVANRRRPDTADLIGMFVNTLVLRGDLGGDPTMAELVVRTRKSVLGAFDHQELPYGTVSQQLRPAPIEVMFDFAESSGDTELDLGGVRCSSVPLDLGVAKFDLTVHVHQADDFTSVLLEYRTDLFEPETVRRFGATLERLLEQLVERPDARLSEVDLLTAEERAQILGSWASTTSFPSDDTVVDRFERWAAATPDAIAVVHEDDRVSYAELNVRANRLAHRLRAVGVTAETLVAICLERGVDLVVAVLGVLKAGGAYVPLDPHYPQERLDLVLSDSQAGVLVARGDFPSFDGTVVDVAGTAPESNPARVAGPDALAYVIYTSGSTGRPKGVLVPHRNIVRLLDSEQRHLTFDDTDVWTMTHSFAFDFSVWELWGPLANGGRLVVVSRETARDPLALHALMAAEGVTILNQTPAAFKGFRLVLDATGHRVEDLTLRAVVFGGDMFDVRDYRDWFAAGADRPQLINMYGITETTVHVTVRPITAADVDGPVRSPIGRPLGDLAAYVLDGHGRPVPVGVPGELFVGGDGLARGYLGRPELTAERFVDNPFVPGTRLYRTGDLVRWLPDGDLEILGRVDHQLKVRGFRIEPSEIESALGTHPAVRESVVVARDDEHGDKTLVAYLVGDEPSAAQLREHLRSRLPEHMIPSVFVTMAALPLSRNGKVDRSALPAPTAERPRVREDGVAHSGTAATLAEIWAEVLGVDWVGVEDNFFAIGGDSILALRVVGLAQRAGLSLSVRDLFRANSLGELASSCSDSGSVEESTAPFAMVAEADRGNLPADAVDAYPLTLMQRGMLYEAQLDAERLAYHNVFSFTVTGSFDLAEFQRRADDVVAAQEILRTSVDLYGYSEPLQIVHREAPLPVGYQDLRGRDEAEREALVTEYIGQEKTRPLDAEQAPLLRVFVHHLTDDSYQLTTTDCHVILDGWSLASLTRELAGGAGGRPDVRFADYVALERRALSSDGDGEYWAERLAQLSPVRVGGTPGGAAHTVERSFRDDAEAVKALAASVGVPVKSVVLAAFHQLMATFTDDPARFVGLVLNGRPERLGADRLLGLFLNTVPFGLRSTATTWAELIRETFEAEQEALPHRRFPFAELQRRHGGGSPLAEVVFNYVHFHVLGDGITQHDDTMARTNFPLAVTAGPSWLAVEADTGCLSAQDCEDLADAFHRILLAMVADPQQAPWTPRPALDRRAGDIEAINRFNDTAHPVPDVTLTELLDRQAAAAPYARAVVFEDVELSYRELHDRANRLARNLIARGVGPEHIVGLIMERSVELVVALLAVLKAGAAYLPIDPALPQERIDLMLADAEPTMVLRTASATGSAEPIGDDDRTAPLTGGTPAYVIYTSGSTGRPKGVVVEHRAIVNRLLWMQDEYSLGPDDRVLQKTPYSFDVSVWEFFWPLITGATLVVARPDGHRDPEYLVDVIRRHAISTVHFVPSMLRAFLQDENAGRCTSLRRVICSGEALPPQLCQQFHATLDVDLFNLYGPTEAAVDVTAWRCEPGAATVPIGRPIWNIAMHVLDEQLRPVPLGVEGDLHIAGVGLARGYLNRPELTAERFVDNPFVPGIRMYKTGDRARWTADGVLEYLGRSDDQVKIRGFRVEPGEIEAALVGHPAVAHAVVVARDEQLVGYVVPDGDTAPSVANWCRSDVDPSLRYTLPNGLAVMTRNRTEADFLYRELFEGREYLRNGITLPADACVFDVGAHIGMFTMSLADLCPDGTFYAFEPIPDLFEQLTVNTSVHGLDAKLFRCGVGEQPGRARFTYYPQMSIMSGRFGSAVEEQAVVRAYLDNTEGASGELVDELVAYRLRGEEVDCPVRTVSEVIREQDVRRIDLLKVDAEKSELDVLRGVDDEHWPIIRQVAAEVHDSDGRLESVVELLRGKGFRVEVDTADALAGTGLVTVCAIRDDQVAPVSEPQPARAWRSPESLVSELRDRLRAGLPEHMVPSDLVLLDRLPVTSNGKLDRKALPAPRRAVTTDGRPPRGPREELLADLFAESLGVARIGIDDSFFDHGGYSLLATRLVGRIRRALGMRLSMGTLIEHPTVAGLAAQLGIDGRDNALSVLLPLRREGTRPPLFCLPPVTGLSWGYTGLMRALGPQYPVYGLQAPGLTDPAARRASVEALAADYLVQIRTVQPHGPYHLVGWSLGGNLAHAIAVQLRDAGEQVALCALIDSYPHARELGGGNVYADLLHNLGHEPDGLELDAARFAEVLRASGSALAGLDDDELRNLVTVFRDHLRLMGTLAPGVFDGDVLFFTATEQRPADRPTHEAWRPHVAGRVVNHDVPWAHHQLTQAAALDVIGAVLAAELDGGPR